MEILKLHIIFISLFIISWKCCDAVGIIDNVTEEFDYIVVGGGTAGCTVARRLSDNGNSVLIIEAGRVPNYLLFIPSLFLEAIGNGSTDAKIYLSVPQTSASLETGGFVPYVVGRTLGGTSAVNGMMFNRGNPHDYDSWAAYTGDPSWRYENLLKHFRRIEDYQGDFPSNTEHGQGGPITVSRPRYTPGLNEWLAAGQHLGYPVADPNGPQRISFSPMEYSQRKGFKVSSFSGYIQPVLGIRPNLKVIMESTVSRVIFEGTRAKQVMFMKNGQQQIARAKREIILSAGPIASPEILMKSGIGPESVLQPAGITPVKILPVGQNLNDHASVYMEWILSNRSAAFIRERDLNPETRKYYNQNGDGPYATYLFRQQAFLASSVATIPPGKNHRSWPDLQFMYGQCPMKFLAPLPWDRLNVSSTEVVVASLIMLTRPKSRGSLILNATNPLTSDPLIDFQYYSHPDDIQAMLDGIRTFLKVFEETPSFQQLGIRYPSVGLRACSHLPFRSDEYWVCYMRQRTASGMHIVGTCKMGRGADDPTAVVDSQLRVIGIEGLRVVDTSIMPQITNANPQVPAYVIGEKASEMIIGAK